MIILKSRREIAMMRAAGRIVARALATASELVRPGVTTGELDAAIESVFQAAGAQPLFKGYPGKTPFPAASCISVNEQVVHGIPGERRLQEGDLVSIDTGCRLAGWCADAAWTYSVGPVDELKSRLLETGQAVLELAIQAVGGGGHSRWSGVAQLLAARVRSAGFSVVEDFVGHGIGREMHEDPQVPNFVSESLKKGDFRLEAGLVLAIEPMVNAGGKETEVLARDHWTVVTKDRQPSVHFEHTVALTSEGPQVLTLL